jgi:hypothetical protein
VVVPSLSMPPASPALLRRKLPVTVTLLSVAMPALAMPPPEP